MSKVQIETSPDITVTDGLGRVLTIKRPNVLAQYRLVEALGVAAENRVYLYMCLPLRYLAAIDGDPVLPPTSKAQVEALIQRLDDAGMEALSLGVEQHFSGQVEADSAKK